MGVIKITRSYPRHEFSFLCVYAAVIYYCNPVQSSQFDEIVKKNGKGSTPLVLSMADQWRAVQSWKVYPGVYREILWQLRAWLYHAEGLERSGRFFFLFRDKGCTGKVS
jgi:hypothetical protein